MTKEQLLKKVQENRRRRELKKRIEERRAMRESKAATPVRPTRPTRTVVENRRPARPIVERKTVPSRLPNRPVFKEAIQRGRGDIKTFAEAKQYALRKTAPSMRKDAEVLLDNMIHAHKTYAEATQRGFAQSQVGLQDAGVDLVKTYFDIWLGFYPNLIAPEIASVQPIKTENARIFYREFVAGSTKGKIQEGHALLTPFTHDVDEEYTSHRVTIAKDTAVALWAPVVPRSVAVEGFDLTWSDNETFAGVSADGKEITGTVAIADEEITVTIGGTDKDDVEFVTYEYDNAFAPTAIPELQVNIKHYDLKATYRTIKTNFSFTAGYGFESIYGVNLSEDLAKGAMYELKKETDLDLIGEVWKSAPRTLLWNKNNGVALGLYESHKLSFFDAIVEASNLIYEVSKRVSGNVLLVGAMALNIIQTLPFFEGDEAGSQLDGAKVVGKLNKNIKVIAVPELPRDEFMVLYKSSSDNLDAGLVYAPYIPVMATEPVTVDLLVHRAFITAYAKKVVNKDYFVRGRIIDSATAQPIQVIDKVQVTVTP